MKESKNVKIVVFVPETHADAVRDAVGNAMGGKIGKYTHCSFSVKGVGRFKPMAGAKPFLGKAGKLETVPEERIEFICDKNAVRNVVAAIKKVHPYEEVALDIYPLLEE